MDGNNTGKPVIVTTKHSRFGLQRMVNTRAGRLSHIKKRYLLVAAVIIIGGPAGLFMYKREQRIAKNICNGRNNNKFYADTAPNLFPQRYKALEKQVNRILSTKNYEKDPNCAYAVFYYYASISDVADAKIAYQKLEAVHNKDFVKVFSERGASFDAAKAAVTGLDTAAKQFETNKVYTN